MTTNIHGAQSASQRREQVESLLAAYPYIEGEKLTDLLQWFRREASALEVGMIASDPKLATQYRRLKTEHLDRFRGADLMWAALFITFFCSFVALVVARAV